MIIIFVFLLATVVTTSQGKYIELLSNEEFHDKLSRRAGEGDYNSEESRISNRDDKSYIPDIDLALTDVYLRSYTGVRRENYADNDINQKEINKTILSLHEGSVTIDENNNNLKEGVEVDHDKNTPDSVTPIQVSDEEPNVSPENNTVEPEKPVRLSDYEHSDTENITEDTIQSTTLPKTSVILSITESNSDKSTTDIEAQAPEYDSEVHAPENDSTVTHYESSSKAIESYIHDSSDSTLTDESTTDYVIDTTTKGNADVFDILDSPIFVPTTQSTADSVIDTTTKENTAVFDILDSQILTTTQNTVEENTDLIEDYIAVTENSSTNEHLETIIETTTFIPALTPTIEEEQSTKKPKKISNPVINAIHKIENITNPERCIYCYRVYEILWPNEHGNQLYLRSQEPIIDQPNFIPVFKYSKNFAHYNPKKRLRPDEMEVDTRQHRKRNNEIDDTAEGSKLLTELNNESRKFVVFKRKDERPKTSDELTIRYGRKGSYKKKTKKKKSVRLFDDTNNDILPELMHAVLGAESVDVPIIDRFEDLTDMDKFARLDLFDFVSLTDGTAKFEDMTFRKRSNDESTINIYMDVLKDLILKDSKAMRQYDWLTTTVQIQSALTKIIKLINRVRLSEPIHPANLQILKYVAFLHNLSLRVKEDNKFNNKLAKRMRLLSINKKKRKSKLLKKKGLINRMWLHLRTLLPDVVEEDQLSHLYEFLIDVQDGLFGLHEAIRHIAYVTKFNRQNWYGNLRELYLDLDEKHLRELLLHISMSRLIDLVENSCKQGLNNDVIKNLQTHENKAKQIVEELLFIGKIVDEIKINIK